MNFYIEQLQNQIKYRENKYLSSTVQYANKVSIEDNFIVKKVIFIGIPYKICKKYKN